MSAILSPLARIDDIHPLIECGADEFYVGINNNKFRHANKRENPIASFTSLDDLKKVKDEVHSGGKKIYLALNEKIYDNSIDCVTEYLQEIEKLALDAYIIQDYAILQILKNIGSKTHVHLSSLAQVWNEEAIRFYTDSFPQISRIIFSRDIQIYEMSEICALFPQMEFEAFVMNDWCYNVDGICASLHHEVRKKGLPYVCHREYNYEHCSGCKDAKQGMRNVLDNRPSCFACAMYKLSQIKNMSSYKIVGRDKPLIDLVHSVKFIHTIRKLLSKNLEYKIFLSYAQELFHRIYSKPCDSEKCQFAYV